MLQLGSAPCSCGQSAHDPALVAITGGPGAGKTAVLELAARAFCEHVAVLPEAASIVFGGGFPRHDTAPGHRAAQLAIFHVQRQLETLVLEERQVSIALCDRGTVDGLAYGTGPWPAYWKEVGTTHEREIARYAAVVHLQTPDLAEGYNRDNPLRVESAQHARVLDERIASAWETHPRRFVIPSMGDFTDKALAALKAIRDQLPTCCHAHPL